MIRNSNKRMRLVLRPRTRMTLHRKVFVMTSFMSALALAFIVFINLSDTRNAIGAANGDYRSVASGNWNNIGTWEKYNGTAWVAATATPTSADGVITIQAGHTVIVTANVTADQITIDAAGILTINSGQTFTLANGAGDDLTMNGSLNINGTLTQSSSSFHQVNGTVTLASGASHTIVSSAKIYINNGGTYRQNGGAVTTSAGFWIVNSGGTYKHNRNGYNLPLAIWNTGSTCEVTGVTTVVPNNINQVFHNFIWNCPGQLSGFDFNAKFDWVTGNLTIVSTGAATLQFDYQGNNNTTNISGNFYMQGGFVYGCANGSAVFNIGGSYIQTGGTFAFNQAGAAAYGSTSTTLSVDGNLTVSGGTIDMTQSTAPNPAIGTGHINLRGNLVVSGTGLITETTITGARGQIHFAGTSIQTYDVANRITNLVDFIVDAGATVQTGLIILTSTAGDFILMSGGHLMIGSPDGITSSGAVGNIQVTGTRTYSTGADYTYNGASAQVTGNGLPATVRNITFNNSSNVTMTNSSSATNLITMTSGKVITGSNELGTTNTSTSSIVSYSSSNYVIGNLRRSVNPTGSYDYPLGTMAYYEFCILNLTAASGFTDVLGTFTKANPIEALLPITSLTLFGNPILDLLDYGYWTLTPNSVMSGGTYTVTLSEQGHTNPAASPTYYCVLKRENILSSWQSLGTHSQMTQSEYGGIAIAARSALSGFSQFAIAKSGSPLPIELVSFDAKPSGNVVKCSWQTATEINNDYFTIERSTDGRNFLPLETIVGAGNSSATLNYSFNDTKPLSGINYYRLMQTDYDGKFSYSKVMTAKFGTGGTKGMLSINSVSPNPFKESFSITYSVEDNSEVAISIFNTNGQNVFSQKENASKGTNRFDFNNAAQLPDGIYFAKLIVNNEMQIQKLVKN